MLSVIRRASDVRTLINDWRSSGKKIGFVPTLGGLHDGHGSLIKGSLEQCDRTIVSIFLNPLQFDRANDLATYPHDEKADLNYVADLGVHAVFYPSPDEMYPDKPLTLVTQSGLTDHLDGASRPGYFDGILTVVTKLFNVVRPDVTFFGQKDFQQVMVIKRLVKDLNFDIEVIGMPTHREDDGLAMSSRNNLLSKQARELAPGIYSALKETRQQFLLGTVEPRELIAPLEDTLRAIPGTRLDYVSIVDPDSMQLRQDQVKLGDLLAVAVYFGEVRLIDNILLDDDPWSHR